MGRESQECVTDTEEADSLEMHQNCGSEQIQESSTCVGTPKVLCEMVSPSKAWSCQPIGNTLTAGSVSPRQMVAAEGKSEGDSSTCFTRRTASSLHVRRCRKLQVHFRHGVASFRLCRKGANGGECTCRVDYAGNGRAGIPIRMAIWSGILRWDRAS